MIDVDNVQEMSSDGYIEEKQQDIFHNNCSKWEKSGTPS